MMVNAVGDRTQPSPRLTMANWREVMQQGGAKFGEAAKDAEYPVYLEFWNEPYLNWANDNRKNFEPQYYDVSRATEGGEVHIKHDGEVAPHLRWTKDRSKLPWDWTRLGDQEFRRGRTADGKLSVSHWARLYQTPRHVWYEQIKAANPPDDVADGETYVAANGTEYTAFTPWTIYDETQVSYWSGKGMRKFYDEPLVEYAQAAKAIGGDNLVLIAGWGNRASENHWKGFYNLYQPTIDDAWQLIDGICDHDYGGSPLTMPTNYEVQNAYAVSTYGKSLDFYNTETASNMDPQAHGGEVITSGDALKFQWMSRKVAHHLALVPDKGKKLAHFGLGGGFWSDGGEGVAMDMLRHLRGRLIYIRHDDPMLFAIASIDGTDSHAPRSDDQQVMTVMLLNDRLVERPVSLTINAPTGASFCWSSNHEDKYV